MIRIRVVLDFKPALIDLPRLLEYSLLTEFCNKGNFSKQVLLIRKSE